ncbi:MAG: 30S ribosomal protein S6 [Endomicrobium sp.]|jgi:small subunit ribosomal protein S6|nr:30S ribosomal protein S6 [Endomicrobium sp.]
MNYESTFIVSPELSTEGVEEVTAKVLKVIETSDGVVKAVQQLGKKKLACPIDKFYEGSYVYIEFDGNGLMIKVLEKFFKFNDSIMRFLTLKSGDKKVAAKLSAVKQSDKMVGP